MPNPNPAPTPGGAMPNQSSAATSRPKPPEVIYLVLGLVMGLMFGALLTAILHQIVNPNGLTPAQAQVKIWLLQDELNRLAAESAALRKQQQLGSDQDPLKVKP